MELAQPGWTVLRGLADKLDLARLIGKAASEWLIEIARSSLRQDLARALG